MMIVALLIELCRTRDLKRESLTSIDRTNRSMIDDSSSRALIRAREDLDRESLTSTDEINRSIINDSTSSIQVYEIQDTKRFYISSTVRQKLFRGMTTAAPNTKCLGRKHLRRAPSRGHFGGRQGLVPQT